MTKMNNDKLEGLPDDSQLGSHNAAADGATAEQARPGSDEPRKLSLPHKIVVCQHVAELIRARLPIVGELSSRVEGQTLDSASAVRSVDADLAAGLSLQDALAGDASRDARSLSACIQAGVQANRLDQSLEAWSEMHLALDRARKSLRSAMLYPVLLMLIMLISLSYLIWQSMPVYAATFQMLSPTLPLWLTIALWVRKWLALFMIAALLLTMLPLVWWFRRRKQLDAHGCSKSKTQRLYSDALAAEVARLSLIAQSPLQRTIELSVQATGANQAAVDAAFGQVQTQQLVPVLSRETSLILGGLHAGVVDRKQAIEHLGDVHNVLNRQADATARRDTNWFPMLVAIAVGCVTLLVYVGLIYGPWILLLRRIVEPPEMALP